MGICKFCGKNNGLISQTLQVCRNCVLTKDWSVVRTHLMAVHETVRKREELPITPPKSEKGEVKLNCNLCLNECALSINDVSYCGLRNVQKHVTGVLPYPSKKVGYLHAYLDPNPTNCCNSWFCCAGTSMGYPIFSNFEGPERGTYNCAVFFYGCTFDCLFCQNASHKHFSKRNLIDLDSLSQSILNNKKVTCVCFFGGTPESQLPFSIELARTVLEKIVKTGHKRVLRFCWEWNGSGNRELVEECADIAVKTGGNIKFDLKSFNEKLNIALCGVSNKRTLDNFEFLAKKYFGLRKGVPELSACTLLVPGYLTVDEIELIAKFVGTINKRIPYTLLIFHPDYQMKDLPFTTKEHALQCVKVAESYCENVNLGNKFLLSNS